MNAFDAASRDALSDFLRTVVVIDDAAYHPGEEGEPIAELKAPGRAPGKAQDAGEPPARSQSAHSLNTRVLVDSFARKGLTCAVLAPQRDEDLAALVDPVAERCDIVVFDWQLGDDDGERTLERIKALCERDGGERLRLMCVYTGEPDLVAISEKLCRRIGLQHVGDDCFLLRKDSVILTILAKKGSRAAPEYSELSVDEKEIADKLLDRFSGVTKGLLSNAVLAALAGINRNAHRIIRKFDATLDPAYISHRIMSNPADTVESEALSLIASELESVVHQSKAKTYICGDAIGQWMHANDASKWLYAPLKCKEGEGQALLNQLINDGADDKREGISAAFKKTCKIVLEDKGFVGNSGLTALLGSGDAKNVDRRFAMLSTLETRYENLAPRLTLGTVISDSNRYLLCLMPRCDSARVPAKGRNFLFVKLVKSPTDVDLIVEDKKELVDLGVSRRTHDTVIYRFAPSTADKPVMARKKRGKWLFNLKKSVNSTDSVRWVAELKPQIAQAFANEYASHVSRVGVAKSQWLHKLKKVESKKK